MKAGWSLFLISLLLAPGCSNSSSTSTTSPTTLATASSEMFTGTLSPGGNQVYIFNVNSTSQVTMLFGSLRVSGTNTTLSTPMKLSVGPASSTDLTVCAGTSSITTAPALVSQVNQQLITGTYCVALLDPGNLSGNADFAILINQLTGNPSVLGSAGTDTFSSNLYPGGTTSKTFSVTAQGNVNVNLTSVQPQGNVGFGIGITLAPNDCFLYQSVVSPAGSTTSINATAEGGAYCIRVFDPGNLAARVTFNIQTSHP